MNRIQRQVVLFSTLIGSSLAFSQSVPRFAGITPSNMTPEVALVSPVLIRPATPPCAKFVEPFDVDDYNGPLSRIVARFSQRVESSTVHVPRHSSGLRPCSMDASDKFRLFVQNSVDPVNFMSAAWNAGTAQLSHEDAADGQGVSGYSKRYSAAIIGSVAGDFFGTFLYPSIFHQDPRYYRMTHGPVKARLGHALVHRFIAQSDSGKRMLNYSEWFSVTSSSALGNLYHSDNRRGFGPTANHVGVSVGNDIAWDVLREFWPEITRKFRLPFRGHNNPYAGNLPAAHERVRPVAVATSSEPAMEGVW
jgi:hypothetical protein